MSLDKEHISLIDSDVKRASLTINSLHDEIVDHICCEVEVLMTEGIDFIQAYHIVKQQFNIYSLQEIEKNTKILIDKNYSLMNTTMKVSGNISLLAITAGTIMKIFNITGANISLVTGFLILSIFFLPSLLYLYKPGSQDGIQIRSLKISTFIGCIAFAAGVILKTMNLPGANILLMLAYSVILLVTLPLIYGRIQKNETDKSSLRLNSFGLLSVMVFVLFTMFKMFHLPGSAVLMLTGCIMLVTIFLPIYTWKEFKKSGEITGRFIFLVILSIYVITMCLMVSYRSIPEVRIISYNYSNPV